MYIKLLMAAAIALLIGGMYLYQANLKTIISEQQTAIVQYEADVDKLVKEIEFMKVDKLSLENGVAALQNVIVDNRKECEQQLSSVEKKYQILMKRKFVETKKLIDGGAIDEKSSKDFIDYFNSRFFAN